MFSLGIAADKSLRREEATLRQKQSGSLQRWNVRGDLLPRQGVGKTVSGSFAGYVAGTSGRELKQNLDGLFLDAGIAPARGHSLGRSSGGRWGTK